MLHRRRIDRLDANGGFADAFLDISPAQVRGAADQRFRRVEPALGALESEHRRLLVIRDANQRGRIDGALERVGDHDGDRLAVIVNNVLLQE